MKEQNRCISGQCPPGIEILRKIGLTPKEKRAIFHSIMNLTPKLDEKKLEGMN